MDEIDLRICTILVQNSRTPYGQISDKAGVSLKEVQKRIQLLQSAGIIAGFNTTLSVAFLDAVVVDIMGTTDLGSAAEVVERLREDDRTFKVIIAEKNFLTVKGLLKKAQDLESYISFVIEAVGMKDPTVGIESLKKMNERPTVISSDYRIAATLQKDTRRPIKELGLELRVSSASVRGRIEKMLNENVITMSIDLHLTNSDIIVGQLRFEFEEGTDRKLLTAEMKKQLGANALSFTWFSNIPDLAYCMVWGRTLQEMEELASKVREVNGVRSVVMSAVSKEYQLQTWRDKLLIAKAR